MRNLAFFREEDGKLVAVLIDYDLASMPPLDKSYREERVGTLPFMARELLQSADIDYGLQHDYESFLYCAVWHGLGYETNDKCACEEGSDKDILKYWRLGRYDEIASRKFAFIAIRHETFDLIKDKSFSERCERIWNQFNDAWIEQSIESHRRREINLEWKCLSGEAPGTKVTYPMLMEALVKEWEPCAELCCC